MRIALPLVLLLGACAGPLPVAPDAADLSPDERHAYASGLRALIDGQPDAAVSEIEALTRREPWYVPAHVVYQDALRARGLSEQARAWYTAEAELAGQDAARVLLAGRVADRAEGGREAMYRRAFALDTDSPWPALALAYELARVAAEESRRALDREDSGYEAEAAEGRVRAQAALAEAHSIVAALLETHVTLADVQAAAAHVALGHGVSTGDGESLEAAQIHAVRAVDLDPGQPRWWALLARVHRELIDDRGAAEALRRALDLAPDDAGLHASLGRVLLDLGQPEEARNELFVAAEARPTDAVVATDLGVAYHRTGQLDDAAEELRRAAGLAPEDPRPCEALALVEIERERADAAAAAVHEYLRRGGSDRASAARLLRELDAPVALPPPR